jgi:Fur family peroxide stress response transcriptional regulator
VKVTQEDIRRKFRERGLKVTPQRAAIYLALAETSRHPTAEDLYRAVKRLHPMISQNTVYYTLGTLKTAGLVHEVNYWHDRSRFDANMALHHHVICLGCRKIQDLSDAALDRLTIPARGNAGFQILGHRVEFHGYCADCRRSKQTRPRQGRGRIHRQRHP